MHSVLFITEFYSRVDSFNQHFYAYITVNFNDAGTTTAKITNNKNAFPRNFIISFTDLELLIEMSKLEPLNYLCSLPAESAIYAFMQELLIKYGYAN